jgi:hypothetical protein
MNVNREGNKQSNREKARKYISKCYSYGALARSRVFHMKLWQNTVHSFVITEMKAVVKAKAVPLHATKALGGRGGMASARSRPRPRPRH